MARQNYFSMYTYIIFRKLNIDSELPRKDIKMLPIITLLNENFNSILNFLCHLSILPKRIYMTNNVLVQLGIEQYLPSIFNICKRAGLYCSSLGCDLMKYFCDIIIFSPTFSVQFCFCKIYFLFMYLFNFF